MHSTAPENGDPSIEGTCPLVLNEMLRAESRELRLRLTSAREELNRVVTGVTGERSRQLGTLPSK